MKVDRQKSQKSLRKPVQLRFKFPGQAKETKEHGGEPYAYRGKRKVARPFDPTKPLHITMRSAVAVEEKSLLHPSRAKRVKHIVYRAGSRHGVVIKKYVCVGNHLHLLVQTKARRLLEGRPALNAFLRESGGLIARFMTGAEKGRSFRRERNQNALLLRSEEVGVRSRNPGPEKSPAVTVPASKQKFWDYLAWSRIVEWGRDLRGILNYFSKNELDAVWVLSLNNWPDVTLEPWDPFPGTRASPAQLNYC